MKLLNQLWEVLWTWIKEFSYSWWELIRILSYRFFEGLKNRNFLIYFITIVVFVGSFGVLSGLSEIWGKENVSPEVYSEVAKSISTYFIAIIATSGADLILNRFPNEIEARILRMPAITFLVIGGFLIFLIQMDITKYSFKLSIIGTALAWFLWWITNSIDPKHKDEDSFDGGATNPMGGPVRPVGNGNNDNPVIPGVKY